MSTFTKVLSVNLILWSCKTTRTLETPGCASLKNLFLEAPQFTWSLPNVSHVLAKSSLFTLASQLLNFHRLSDIKLEGSAGH